MKPQVAVQLNAKNQNNRTPACPDSNPGQEQNQDRLCLGRISTVVAGPALASTPADLEPTVATVAAPADDSVDLAYLCEYVIVWDAWGNAYYEYICY